MQAMSDNTTKFHMIEQAPNPVAPYSHAVENGGWVFLTGQMPNFPEDPNKPLPEGIEAQTCRVMDNLDFILKSLNLTLQDVVQARVYLTHFERDYALMNETYQTYFEKGRLPARTCIGVTGLAINALVEIDMVAKRPEV